MRDARIARPRCRYEAGKKPSPPCAGVTGVGQEMLEEAVDVIRLLHRGEEVGHHGKRYTVQEARIHTRPDQPVPIYVPGFGPQGAELAGRIGDGYVLAMPDGDLVKAFRNSGGGDKPVQAGTKVCWDQDSDAALKTAHRLWGNEGLSGQTSQILPRPKDFAALTPLVPLETVAESVACGPDPDKHAAQVRKYIDADIDEVYVQRIGPDMDGFFSTWECDVLPQVRG